MEKKTTISVGRSVNVFRIGEQESWTKISISKDFPEGVDCQKAIDDLMEELRIAHDKHSQSTFEVVEFPGKKSPVKLNPDPTIKKEYMEALAANDTKKVALLQGLYNFQIGK